MATLEGVEHRVLELEIHRGIYDKIKELEDKVRDLESMVRTARYFVTVAAGLITIVGILVTAYVTWMSGTITTAKNQIADTAQHAITDLKSQSANLLRPSVAEFFRHTYLQDGSDPHYYTPSDHPVELLSTNNPHEFRCADGYYMIGIDFHSNGFQITGAQGFCRKPLTK